MVAQWLWESTFDAEWLARRKRWRDWWFQRHPIPVLALDQPVRFGDTQKATFKP